MDIVFWILWFIVGLTLVGVFACTFLPYLLLKADAATYKVRDRALGRYNLKDGVTFLYEPSPSAVQYIGKYQVYETNEGKFFVGEWAQKLSSANFDLFVYDAKNSIKTILNVQDKKIEGTQTRVVPLPDETDYVSVRVNRADNEVVRSERRLTARYVVMTLLFALFTALVVDVLIWLIATFIMQLLAGFPPIADASFDVLGDLLGYVGTRVALIVFFVAFLWAFFTRREVKRHE